MLFITNVIQINPLRITFNQKAESPAAAIIIYKKNHYVVILNITFKDFLKVNFICATKIQVENVCANKMT